MHNTSVGAVLERLGKALEAKTDSDLARLLDVNRQTLGSWRTRGSVPYALCVKVAEEKGLSLDWLLTGRGRMHPDAPSEAEELNPRQRAVLDLFTSLSEDDQREILRDAEEKKRIADMERRLEELAAKVEQRNRSA